METPNTDRVSEEGAHESENKVIGGAEYTSADMSQTDEKCEYGAAVQTRAKSEEVNQKKNELKVVHVPGTEVTTEELIELQKADETTEKYWDLSKQPSNIYKKVSFIEKKGILYRSYSDKRGDEIRLQLVVPEKLRQRVLSMAHDTLLGGHRGVAKTQDRVTSEFYWPGIHDDIRRYCWSCDVCQRNVFKGSVGRAHLGQMPLVETPYSTICVDLVGPLSPPSEGHRFISTVINLCTRFPDAVPLKDIDTSTVAEALIGIFSRVGITRKIHSDRGSQFTSEMMSEVSRLLSI